jgi:hypothetical protein
LNIWSGDVLIGIGRLFDVVLRPGDNKLPIDVTIDLQTVISNIDQIISFQSQYLEKGVLRIGASGNSTIYNGYHIPYYEQVFRDMHVYADIPSAKFLIDSFPDLLDCPPQSECSDLTYQLKDMDLADGLELVKKLATKNRSQLEKNDWINIESVQDLLSLPY